MRPDDPEAYIYFNVAELKRGPDRCFPCQFKIMDLQPLGLALSERLPSLTLIREEWNVALRHFRSRTDSGSGSMFLTGQPGIGEPLLH